VNSNIRRTPRHLAWPSLAMAALVVLGEAVVPAAALADTGGTNTIKVLGAPTYAGVSSGSFTVHLVANGSVAIKGAAAGLQFDTTKLTLTGLADTRPIGAGVTDLGWPVVDPGPPPIDEMTPAIAAMNHGGTVDIGGVSTVVTAGHIPTMGWGTTGTAKAAETDWGIFDATFSIKAAGNNTLHVEADPAFGGIIDGDGAGLTVTTIDGSVVNPAPPTALLSSQATIQTGTSMMVTWTGTPGTNPIASYDVRYRKVAYSSSTFSAYSIWKSATPGTSGAFTLTAGYTYCFSVLARDINGLTSAWTADKCTISPVDDRSLTRTGSWSAKTSTSYYRGTYLEGKALNVKLTRASVKYKRVYLIASTCTTCGSVKVYLGTTLLKTISLKGATGYKKAFLIYSGAAVKSGSLSIKVSTSAKPVRIDGLALGLF
jgi:hypothetical protein